MTPGTPNTRFRTFRSRGSNRGTTSSTGAMGSGSGSGGGGAPRREGDGSDGEWLGFGCGAHSTRRGVREKNIASTEDYVSAIVAGKSVESERRMLSDQERLEEALFTGLRLAQGVNLGMVQSRYGVDLWERYGEDLSPFV